MPARIPELLKRGEDGELSLDHVSFAAAIEVILNQIDSNDTGLAKSSLTTLTSKLNQLGALHPELYAQELRVKMIVLEQIASDANHSEYLSVKNSLAQFIRIFLRR